MTSHYKLHTVDLSDFWFALSLLSRPQFRMPDQRTWVSYWAQTFMCFHRTNTLNNFMLSKQTRNFALVSHVPTPSRCKHNACMWSVQRMATDPIAFNFAISTRKQNTFRHWHIKSPMNLTRIDRRLNDESDCLMYVRARLRSCVFARQRVCCPECVLSRQSSCCFWWLPLIMQRVWVRDYLHREKNRPRHWFEGRQARTASHHWRGNSLSGRACVILEGGFPNPRHLVPW